MRLPFFFCLLLATAACFAQDKKAGYNCIPCDYKNTGKLEKNKAQMAEKNLYCFLRDFSLNECENSAEYSEYANELLFDLLLHNASAVVDILDKYPSLSCPHLFSEIQSPLTDAIDLSAVMEKVKSVHGERIPKLKILLALRIAGVHFRFILLGFRNKSKITHFASHFHLLLILGKQNSRHPNRRQTDTSSSFHILVGLLFLFVGANKLETIIGEYRFAAATSRM